MIEKSLSLRDSSSVSDNFGGMGYGLIGSLITAPFAIADTFNQAGAGMAQARQEISSYTGGQAVLGRTAMLFGDFAFGTSSLVNTPVQSVAGIPGGVVNLGYKIGGDVSGIYSNGLSINGAFNLLEDAVSVAGIVEGVGAGVRTASAFSSRGASFSSLMRQVESLDVSTGQNAAVFYSGRGNRALAESFAASNGRLTLEMTKGGAWLDNQKLFGPSSTLTPQQATAVWSRLSERFAQGASGNAVGFVNGARANGIFNTVEFPALQANPNVGNVITGGH